MSPLEVSRRFPASALRVAHEGTELVLRPLALGDAHGIVAAIDESMVDLRTFMPWAHLPQTVEGQIARIRKSISPGLEGADFQLGLFVASSNRFLAGSGLHPRSPLNPDGALEIGYWTRSSEAGRGLASLMSRMLIVYAFEALGIDRVQICHNADNAPSRRVIEKCGFRSEGVQRNALRAPTPQMLADGFSPCRDVVQYALVPEDRADLPWYVALRDRIGVVDQLGEERGFLWRT